MKRILTFMFISIFAFAFSIGFFSCKKKAEEGEVSEQKTEEAAPAPEEKKMEKK